jgi:hypothetical protein
LRNQRKRVWIDRFQTYLSVRIAVYFLLYQVAVWSAVAIGQHIFPTLREVLGEGVAASSFVFLAGAVVFLGFVFIYDAVILTHRVVGPLYRFRQAIRAVAAGEPVDLLSLRKNDFLQEMKDDFNEMLRVLEERGAVTLKRAEAGHQNQPASA